MDLNAKTTAVNLIDSISSLINESPLSKERKQDLNSAIASMINVSEVNSPLETETDKDNYHKNFIHTIFRIADANWGMYHNTDFDTVDEALVKMDKEYTNRNTGDADSDNYWRNRKHVVLKITTIQEVLK